METIKRITFIGPVKSGGINVVDIVTKLNALKASLGIKACEK